MEQPQPPGGDSLDEAIIAWADASARLAAALRSQKTAPNLTLVTGQPRPAAATVTGLGALSAFYWWWARLYHHAAQWHLAFVLHPGYLRSGWTWGMVASGAVAWRIWLRVIPPAPGRPRLYAVPRR